VKIGDKVDHEEILELLPWFVNGSLSEQERERVTGHLEVCAICVAEKDQLQRLQDLVTSEEFKSPQYQPSYEKLMSRIDAAEQTTEEADDARVKKFGNAQWSMFALAASLLLAVFLIPAVWQTSSESVERTDRFRTLTSEAAIKTPTGITQRVELVFNQPIEVDARRAVLIETDSYIVSGPDEKNRYIVEIVVPGNMTEAEFITSLNAIDGVKYAAFLQAGTVQPH